MHAQSCWITTEGEHHRSRRYLLGFVCVGCKLSNCTTLERDGAGIVLSEYKSAYPLLKSLLSRLCWVPTEGARISISCASCGQGKLVCQFSRVGGGISFTLAN